MRLNRVFFANFSLALTLLYAFLTVLLVYFYKMPAIGLSYILAIVVLGFLVSIVFYPPKVISLELGLALAVFFACGISVFAQGVLQKDLYDYFGRSTHSFTQSVYFQNSLWLFSGMAVARAAYGANNFLAWAIIFIAASLVWPNLGEGLVVSYSDIAEEGFEGVNHLLVAEMVLFLSFFSYSLSSGPSRAVLIGAIGALVFASGGRSSFYLGIASFFLYEFIYGSNRRYFYWVVACLLLLALSSTFVLDFENEAVQRMFFMGGVSDDLSYAERNEYLVGGLLALPEQFLFGDPGWLVRTYGSAGTYIHNVLSAWQFFGAAAFIMIVFLIFSIAVRVKNVRKKLCEPVEIFGVLCLFYGFIGILISKFVGFSFFWFAAGYWVFRLDYLRAGVLKARC